MKTNEQIANSVIQKFVGTADISFIKKNNQKVIKEYSGYDDFMGIQFGILRMNNIYFLAGSHKMKTVRDIRRNMLHILAMGSGISGRHKEKFEELLWTEDNPLGKMYVDYLLGMIKLQAAFEAVGLPRTSIEMDAYFSELIVIHRLTAKTFPAKIDELVNQLMPSMSERAREKYIMDYLPIAN